MNELILKARQKSELMKQQNMMPELVTLLNELTDALVTKKEEADSYMAVLCKVDKLRCDSDEVLASENSDGYYKVSSQLFDAIFRK